MSQLDIKIRKLQDNGSTFRANIETLYLGGVRSAKVDELRFELPEEWKNCTVTLHVQRLSGTKPDPQLLDEQNSALVDRRWTLEKEGTWMLLAINDSGYIAMTKPGKYTCYDTIDTDTTTENITPSIYEQFVAEVTKYAKQALESMNAAKTSEEAAAKSAKEAANSAASMEESVRVSGENAKKAANSAAAAKKSEEAAAKSTEASENSAKKSAESASASKASAEKAKDSEEAAKKSEDAAALSETNAAASEKNAKTSETAAKRALQDTETEHTAALQNIAQARTAALNDVANSTKTATTAANTATQQATAAAGSASAAATKAGEASTSAGAAFNSRQAAEKAQKAAEDAAALAGTRAGTDKTLTIDGAPADAKTVGDKLKAHNHSKLTFEHGNEVNFVGTPDANIVYWGYRDSTIDEYRFSDGQGSGAYANVRANKFIGSLDGNADTATKATGVTDYNNSGRLIQVGWEGDGLNTSNLTHMAGYTDNGTKIKDVSKDVLKSWLGLGSAAYEENTIVRDVGDGRPLTFNYSADSVNYNDFIWIPVWIDGQMKTVNKNVFSTSGVQSSGSNYIRFGDGTQICWYSIDSDGSDHTWSFPVAFSNTEYSVVGCPSIVLSSFCTSKGTTSCALHGVNGQTCYYIAVGRWR